MAGLTSSSEFRKTSFLGSPFFFYFCSPFFFFFFPTSLSSSSTFLPPFPSFPPLPLPMKYLRDSLLLFLTVSSLSASLFLLYTARTLRPQGYLSQICCLIAASTITCCCLFLFIITFHFKADKFREWVERRGEVKASGKKRASPLVKGKDRPPKGSRRRRRVTPPPILSRVSSSAPSPVLSSSSPQDAYPIPFLASPVMRTSTPSSLGSFISSPASITSFPETFPAQTLTPDHLASSPSSSPLFTPSSSPVSSPAPSPSPSPSLSTSPHFPPPNSSPLSQPPSPSPELSSSAPPQTNQLSLSSSSSSDGGGLSLSASDSPPVPRSVLNNVVKALSASSEPEGFMSRRYRHGTHAKFQKMNMFPDFGVGPPVRIQRTEN